MSNTVVADYFNPTWTSTHSAIRNLYHQPNNNHNMYCKIRFLESPIASSKRLPLCLERILMSLTAQHWSQIHYLVSLVTYLIVFLPPMFETYHKLHQCSTTLSLMSPHDVWRSNALTGILAWVYARVLWGVFLFYRMVQKLTKVYTYDTCHMYTRVSFSCILSCKYMTFLFGIPNNIFPFHAKLQIYHLKCPNVFL